MGFKGFLLVLVAAAIAAGQAGAPQEPPRFRAGVDVIQLDVAVLDGRRRPVAGLTAADFTVLEDGKPRPLVAFQELSAPDPDGSLVPWMRDVAPDVRTNSADGRRVFALVLDDVSIVGGMDELQTVDNVKKIARAFVERMGTLDQACILFTGDNRLAQDFTNDRQALLAVVNKFHGTSIPPELRAIYSPSVVRRAAESLIEVSHRRKAMIYVGTGFRVSVDVEAQFAQGAGSAGRAALQSQQAAEAQNAILQAQKANVSIYTINPRGLETFTDDESRIASNVGDDALYSVANATGGFAVTNTNSFGAQVGQIFSETGSYYLLGFQSAYTDGKFRRINVNVNQPGLSVRTRTGYYAPKAEKPDKPPPPLFKALAGVLPNPDMYMRAAVAPFAVADRPNGDKNTGGVAVTLGLLQPATGERSSYVIDLIAGAFTREGKPVASRRQTARLTLRQGQTEDAKFEILSRLDLPPGRYNLRFALHNTALGKSGSVYAEVDVPNYEKDKLSLSGAVVSVAEGLPAAGKDALKDLVPYIPTTQRSFIGADRVTVFLRVYQGGKKPAVPIAMRATIKDARDTTVFESKTALDSAREADYSLALPTTTLAPGAYLLTIEASADEKITVKRDVRFSIR